MVFSDYKGADTLSLRHMVTPLPSNPWQVVRGPHLVAMLDTITTRSLATAAKEGFVQVERVEGFHKTKELKSYVIDTRYLP